MGKKLLPAGSLLGKVKMIKDYSTGETRFVFYTVNAPDGRFQGERNIGGITHQTAMHEANQHDKHIVFSIFDSISEDKYIHKIKRTAESRRSVKSLYLI